MTHQSVSRPLWVLCAVLFIGVALASAGCDDFPLGGYDPFGYGYDAIQSVLDYRQDVYDAANEAWDEYIRM